MFIVRSEHIVLFDSLTHTHREKFRLQLTRNVRELVRARVRNGRFHTHNFDVYRNVLACAHTDTHARDACVFCVCLCSLISNVCTDA